MSRRLKSHTGAADCADGVEAVAEDVADGAGVRDIQTDIGEEQDGAACWRTRHPDGWGEFTKATVRDRKKQGWKY